MQLSKFLSKSSPLSTVMRTLQSIQQHGIMLYVCTKWAIHSHYKVLSKLILSQLRTAEMTRLSLQRLYTSNTTLLYYLKKECVSNICVENWKIFQWKYTVNKQLPIYSFFLSYATHIQLKVYFLFHWRKYCEIIGQV